MRSLPALPRFLVFYAALFSALGAASPFLPGLLQQDGLGPNQLGIVLAAGSAIRLFAGPFGGRLADRSGRAPLVLAGFTAASALVALGYGPARGLLLLALVSMAHACVLSPLTPVADALALGSAQAAPRFRYGWVRGAGSAAFIVGTLAAGRLVGDFGLGAIVWANAALLGVAACTAWFLPNRLAGSLAAPPASHATGSWELLRIPMFLRLMGVVALVGGSHALHDGFEVIRWRSAGLSTGEVSILWSMSVAAEVLVFVGIGPWLLERLGPGRAAMLAAAAGVVRWGVAARTASFPAMAVVEPLHGLTFALLHLTAMDMIGRVVPVRLAATAQAFYATIAMGATASLVTLASGPLYGELGAGAFWVMAGMCAMAIPLAANIRLPATIFGESRRQG